MTADNLQPKDYGLNHNEWRPGQREMIDWGFERMIADSAVAGICEAATGTGKTTLPRALSSRYKTIALVRTKSLQANNYERGYGFEPVYGRNAYSCVHEDAAEWAKADDCLFSDSGMIHCNHGKAAMQKVYPERVYDDMPARYFTQRFDGCPYVVARETAKGAERAALNYAYWLHTYEKWPTPQALVCDEGHQLSEQVLEWAGTTVSDEKRRKWQLMPFPLIRGGEGGMLTKTAPATERAIVWLVSARDAVKLAHKALEVKAQNDEDARKEARRAELFAKKLDATISALYDAPEDWYIKSGPGVINGQMGFVARPLTAKHHFRRYFTNPAWHLFIMSATIGDPSVFAEELGLTDSYEHYCVPSLFPADSRPVLALDVPSMGRGATEKELNKRAEEIAKAIKDCPSNWSGIIHVTSMKEAPELAQRLAKRGLQDRVWVSPQGIGTDNMVKEWQKRRRQVSGSINISWAMWEGYDGTEEKISIVAKCAFPFLGDEYEVARRNYNAKLYLQRTAWAVEQGLGRSRRGRPEDYDTADERRGLVAIADGSYRMIKNYFSQSLRESIIKT